jgi:hypothetical protein
MSSEWMKVMLDEIARKKAEANEAQAELERRGGEQAAHSPSTIHGESSGGRPTGGRPPQ